jgi:hypothetical protein
LKTSAKNKKGKMTDTKIKKKGHANKTEVYFLNPPISLKILNYQCFRMHFVFKFNMIEENTPIKLIYSPLEPSKYR